MKLALILLAVMGVALATAPSGVKADDLRVPLNRILAHIDLPELDRVLTEIFQTDQGSIILLYLRGAGFGRILDAIDAETEISNVLDYIEQNGIEDVRDFLRQILADLGINRPTESPLRSKSVSPHATFEELLEQLAACFDPNGLIETALDVINNDEAAYNFLNYLARPEMAATWQRLKVHKDVVSLLNLLTSAGLDVETVINLIEAILGWGPPTRF